MTERRRGYIEIIYFVLKTLESSIKTNPTYMLRHCNLSFPMWTAYKLEIIGLNFAYEKMEKKGHKIKKVWELTDKGREFLRTTERLFNLTQKEFQNEKTHI